MKWEVVKQPAPNSQESGVVMCHCKTYAQALCIANSLSNTDKKYTYIAVER